MRTQPDAPLAPLTTLGLGGPARLLVTAETEQEVVDAVRAADTAEGPVLVLGGGSNVVVPDEGFPGTVVHVATGGTRATCDGTEVAAGEDWDSFVAACVRDGWCGVEALSGIPGRIGATPVQNVGAYGQDVAQTVTSVRAYDRRSDRVVTLPAVDCAFSYRSSTFKLDPGRWVVLAVSFGLHRGELSAPVRYAELARSLGIDVGARAPLAQVREHVLRLRRGKGMVLDPADPDSRSAGSFFTNPVLGPDQLAALLVLVPDGVPLPTYPEGDGRTKVSAAWLIERAGFRRGHGTGRAGISGKHSLALVNRGAARTADLLGVAREVRDGVLAAYGVELVPEPVLVGGLTL